MWKVINEFLVSVDDFVWGIPLMVLILAGGILLTTRLGLLQMRRLPLALKWMFKNEEEGDGEISSFAALCTALKCDNRYPEISSVSLPQSVQADRVRCFGCW